MARKLVGLVTALECDNGINISSQVIDPVVDIVPPNTNETTTDIYTNNVLNNIDLVNNNSDGAILDESIGDDVYDEYLEDKLNTEFDTVSNGIDVLTDIGEQVNKSVDNLDGVNETDATAIITALEGIANICNVTKPFKVSLESLDSATAEKGTTAITLEGIAEIAKAIWIKLKEYVIKLFDFFDDLYKQYFLNVDGIQNRMDKLLSKFGLNDKKLNTKEVTSNNVNFKRLLSDNTVFDLDKFITDLNNSDEFLNDFISFSKEQLSDFKKMTNRMYEVNKFRNIKSTQTVKYGTDNKPTELSLDFVIDNNNALISSKLVKEVGVVESNNIKLKSYKSVTFPNQQAFCLHYPEDKLIGDDAINVASKIHLSFANESLENIYEQEVKYKFDSATLITLFKAVGNICRTIESYKNFQSELNSFKSKLKADNFWVTIWTVASSNDSDFIDVKKNIKTIITYMLRVLDKPIASVIKYNISLCSNTLDFCEQALTGYQKA